MVSSLPMKYLGLPLEAPFKAKYIDKNPKIGNSKGLVIDNFLDDELVDSGYTYRLTYLGKQGKEITLQGKEINLLSCHTENRLKGEIAVGGWTGLAPAATSLIGQPPALVKP
jgi:hypothetical protein